MMKKKNEEIGEKKVLGLEWNIIMVLCFVFVREK